MSTQPPSPSPGRPAARSPLVFIAIAGASILAAGVGGYIAQSHRQAEIPSVQASPAAGATTTAPPAADVDATPRTTVIADSQPVAEPIDDDAPAPVERPEPASRAARAETQPSRPAPQPRVPVERPRPSQVDVEQARVATAKPAPPVAQAPVPPARSAEPAPAVETPAPEPPVAATVPAPAPIDPVTRPQSAQVTIAETFTIPADSVIGLEIEHSVSSETARLEDRVDARVTRDVKVDGTVVIPAGSRVRGAVTRVENGGRFKERGRIEIRFHTLVLPDGERQTIETDPLFREGENVGRKASTRIGASAAGGAIIGAIFGGEKGAAIGAAAGAGAGTAATAAQKPSEARFRAGSVVTVRLTAPVAITVQQ